jgi:hypothetical protein
MGATSATTRGSGESGSRMNEHIITLLGIALAVGIVVLGAVLAIAGDNGYGGRQYMQDLILTLFGLAALLFARNHWRHITGRRTASMLTGDSIQDDPMLR